MISLLSSCDSNSLPSKIDRKEVVKRNRVEITDFDPFASLSVGNGNFAFTTDITGLQTFHQDYEDGVSLGTMSNWGWHSFPNTEGFLFSDTETLFEVQGRQVPFRNQVRNDPKAKKAENYFRSNPHRIHLGLIGLDLRFADGRSAEISDIKDVKHSLDLWTGKVTSDFTFDQERVKVEVFCHQESDIISAKIESSLLEDQRLTVLYTFPAPLAEHMHSAIDLENDSAHQTSLRSQGEHHVIIERKLDTIKYITQIQWEDGASVVKYKEHQYRLSSKGSEIMTFSTTFTEQMSFDHKNSFLKTKQSSQAEFEKYWKYGGFVDFGNCTDPRAPELERRVILSQYLTKIQSTGDLPPAETGLTANSWYGKFHMEMLWWHVAHFAQWDRGSLVEQQLDYYNELFSIAKKTALDQGYEGVRWQKMLGIDGENSPSRIGSFLIWQQPHIIWLAEQQYRVNPTLKTLEKYEKLIHETANFMADFATWDEEGGAFILEAPLIPAQEHWDKMTTMNPPFELSQWYWGLSKAQEWRERLNKQPIEKWEEVRLNLASPDVHNGLYLGIEGAIHSYDSIEYMKDHPMVLGAYGLLPAWDKIDSSIMLNTLDTIAKKWNWDHTWGWDYPLAAMSAIRLHQPEMAIDLLLKEVPKNRYLPNGHNYQTPNLKIYLPGNGGLLYTIAMMCAGWDGQEGSNIGFPRDGTWEVKWEGLEAVF